MTVDEIVDIEWRERAEHAPARAVTPGPWVSDSLQRGTEISFEFFPPATPAGSSNLVACAEELAPLGPTFVSVTYGAGGSTQDRTYNAIRELSTKTELDVAGHLTCVGAERATVDSVIDAYREAGVRRLVALRGDPPDGTTDGIVEGGYPDAAALVAGIRARPDGGDFDISVAGYPEVHPKAASAQADLDNLRRKVDAGADRVLTQFFFDTDAFLRFHERALDARIEVPIVPGIMPVTDFTKIAGFAARCGTVIPVWMAKMFEGLEESPHLHQMVSATLAAEQCRRLAEHGFGQFHFYTMNRPELTAAVCRFLGITGSDRETRRAS